MVGGCNLITARIVERGKRMEQKTVRQFGSHLLRDKRPLLGLILTTPHVLDYPKQIITEANRHLGKHNTPHLAVEMINFGTYEDLIVETKSTDKAVAKQAWKDITYLVGSAACRLEDANVQAIAICPSLPAGITDRFKLQKAQIIIPDTENGADFLYVSQLATWYCRQMQKDLAL